MSKPTDKSNRSTLQLESEKSRPSLPAPAEPLATEAPIAFDQLTVIQKIKDFAAYYKLVLSRTGKETRASLDLTWTGTIKKLVLYLLVVVVTAWLSPKGLEKEVPDKLIWLAAFIASAFVYLAWNLARAPFLIHQDSVRSEKKALDENRKLEERLRPNLTIIFKRNQVPFTQVYPGDHGQVTQYRVCVVSPDPITDVELVVNKLQIGGIDHSGYHLRPRHEGNSERGGTKRVALKSFKEDFWDVFTAHANDGVVLNTIASFGLIILPAGEYEFELMASGGSNPPATMIATLNVQADNSVVLDVHEGRLSELLI